MFNPQKWYKVFYIFCQIKTIQPQRMTKTVPGFIDMQN